MVLHLCFLYGLTRFEVLRLKTYLIFNFFTTSNVLMFI